MTADIAPGWYDDPAGSGGHRYWDGSAWTDHVRAPGAPAAVEGESASLAGTAPTAVGEPSEVANEAVVAEPAAPTVPAAAVPAVATPPAEEPFSARIPPGFYDDPRGTGMKRFFDGREWTERYEEEEDLTPSPGRCPVCRRDDAAVPIAATDLAATLSPRRPSSVLPLLVAISVVAFAVVASAAFGLAVAAPAALLAGLAVAVLVAGIAWRMLHPNRARAQETWDACAQRLRSGYLCRRDNVAYASGARTGVPPAEYARTCFAPYELVTAR